MIMNAKKGTFYEKLATNKYDEMIFDVEEDVYNDFILKEANDEKELVAETKETTTTTASPFTVENVISISRFVNEYLKIPGDCSNLYHSGLKDLGCSYVMGVDNSYANKNPELVYQGYLLLVMDANNNRGTYINPFYLDKLIDKDKKEEKLKTFYKRMAIDLSKLNDYFKKYIELTREVEVNDEVYNLLKETHKVNKFKKLVKERDVENEKY